MALAVRNFKKTSGDVLWVWAPKLWLATPDAKGCSAFPLDPGKYFNKNVYSQKTLGERIPYKESRRNE
jgi:hypothetical protein